MIDAKDEFLNLLLSILIVVVFASLSLIGGGFFFHVGWNLFEKIGK